MGIDFLDITFRIEKEFAIPISDDDVHGLVRNGDITVGDLYDFILTKMNLRDFSRNDIRLNYALWTELQALMHSVTEVPLEQVELKTPLETLFPIGTRRESWQAFRDACPYRVCKLDYPKFVRSIAFLLAAAVVLIEQFQILQFVGVGWLWPVLGLISVFLLVETYAKMLSILSHLRKRCYLQTTS